MWPIEVIKVLNDPEKYAKTELQKQKIEGWKRTRGFTIKVDKPKEVEE